jgi:hypothetical protein
MMRTKVLGLTAVALLAFSGTALAAGFNAGQLQAVLDRAERAAPAGSTVRPSSKEPVAYSSAPPVPTMAPAEVGRYVGNGSVALQTKLVQGKSYGLVLWVAQSETPALAKTAWQATEAAATSFTEPGAATATNFENRTIKGHAVTFWDQASTATVNGQPTPLTRVFGAVADGRHLLQFYVDQTFVVEDNPAKARAVLRRWITRYLR